LEINCEITFCYSHKYQYWENFASLKLIENIAKHKLKVGVCKPIETGVEGEPLDAKRLLKGVKIHNNNFKSLRPKKILQPTLYVALCFHFVQMRGGR